MGSQEQDMHIAVRNGDMDAMNRLLSSGTDINCLFYGWTPLQLAIDIGRQDMATVLINSGCNVEFHDTNDKAPFEEALIKKQHKVVKALLLKGVRGDTVLSSGHTPLTYAVANRSLDLLEVLVQGGVDVNRYDKQGHTAVYLAAKKGQENLVTVLVGTGANINSPCKEEGCHTPLIAAAANEHKQIVSFLVKQRKCDIDYQDTDGWTALWHAYSNGSEDICAILLQAGANKNLPNGEGRSVIQDAMDNEEEVMLEVFQKYNNMM